jgi:hypothetical protein
MKLSSFYVYMVNENAIKWRNVIYKPDATQRPSKKQLYISH